MQRKHVFLLLLCLLLLMSSGAQAATTTSVTTSSAATTWESKKFDLPSGRSYFARVPVGDSQKRPVIMYAHGAGFSEEFSTAEEAFNGLQIFAPSAIVVYPLSLNQTKVWDAGVCCSDVRVDEVQYLKDIVGQLSSQYAVDAGRVGVIGDSNGGMLAHMAACTAPEVFKAGVSFAGTYTGPCSKSGVRIAQWHGSDDPFVPVDGGTLNIGGKSYDFPPVTAIAKRMSPDTQFTLVIVPGLSHFPTFWIYWQEVSWLLTQFG